MIGLINADKHDGAAAVGPILQDDLLLEVVIFLDWLVDLVVHVFIVLYGLEIVHVETCDLLAVGDTADVLVTLLHLFPDLYASCSHFIQLLEIRVILVQNTPKFQINQGSFLKFLENQVLLTFDSELTDEI